MMNKLISTLYLVLLFHISFAEIPTIKEQLEGLNKCWKYQLFEDQALNARVVISDDEVKFIQFHLSFVEQKLRKANIDHLNYEQKKKRAEALEILHKYMLNGVFPKNLYHEKRTPYFIDHLGTACAVGYLIIKTGNKKLADKISIENNNDYIYQLDLKYPQLRKWADEYGFTIDELAWIQPGYIVCDTACNESISIWATGGVEPYSFHWNNSVVVYQTMSNSQYVFVCPGNFYLCTVIDANGDTIPSEDCSIAYDAMIALNSNSIIVPYHGSLISTTSNNATLGCNGNAMAIATNFPPHDYNWYQFNNGWQWLSDAQVIGNLCPGQYKVVVTNAYNCTNTVTIDIESPTNVDEKNEEIFNIYPNPGNEYLIISNLSADTKIEKIEVFNISGEKPYLRELFNGSKNEIKISISHLPAGFYNIRITVEDKLISRKFIKK